MNNSKKRKRSKKKGNAVIVSAFLFMTIFSVIVTIFIAVNSISDKEKLRDKGVEAYKAGHFTEAIKLFEDSKAEKQWFSDKLDYDSNLYMADCHMQLEQYKEAYDLYVELEKNVIRKSDKAYIESMIKLSDALYKYNEVEDFAELVPSLEEAYNAGNKSIALYLGACCLKSGENDKAVKYFKDYAANYGYNTYIYHQLAVEALERGDLQAAADYVQNGFLCEDKVFADELSFDQVVLLERSNDFKVACDSAYQLVYKYPENETYRKEYDFLFSRITIDEEPVNKP